MFKPVTKSENVILHTVLVYGFTLDFVNFRYYSVPKVNNQVKTLRFNFINVPHTK